MSVCIQVLEGDNKATTLGMSDMADRVNLGLIPSSEDGYATAIRLLRAGGGWLHVHGNCEAARIEQWASDLVAKLALLAQERGVQWKVRGSRSACAGPLRPTSLIAEWSGADRGCTCGGGQVVCTSRKACCGGCALPISFLNSVTVWHVRCCRERARTGVVGVGPYGRRSLEKKRPVTNESLASPLRDATR